MRRRAHPALVGTTHPTNRDLEEAVERGEFRRDLFYRLNAFRLQIPPLRDRRDDIPVLAAHFLQVFTAKYRRQQPSRFAPETQRLLIDYDWPGNIRELRNVIERAVVLGRTEQFLPEHLPREIAVAAPVPAAAPAAGDRPFDVVLPEAGISLEISSAS